MAFYLEVFIVGLLAAGFRRAAPLLWATMGELTNERSGILNLGIEGIMLFGAFGAYWTVYNTGNLYLGLLVAAIIGALIGLLVGFICITLRANQVLTGLGVSIMGLGVTFYLYRAIFGFIVPPPTVKTFPIISVPLLSEIPVLGPILFQHYMLVWIAIIIVPIFWFILFRTTLGLKIRAIGENPLAADTVGINVFRIRYLCVLIAGTTAGIAGAFFTIAQNNMFLYNITEGRGFICIALCVFSSWNPWKALVGALLFGAVEGLGYRIQAMGSDLPYQFALMLPYILTIIALQMVSRKATAPAALGKAYKRGEH